MRLTIEVDAMNHQIDSTDPELLGRWVMEIFGRIAAFGITPATFIRVQIYPSWVPDESVSGGRSDWVADSRIIGRTWQIHSPRDLVKILGEQLDEAEGKPDAVP